MNSYFISDVEINQKSIEEILKLAQNYSTGEFPQNDFINSYLNDHPECWYSIRNEVSKFENQYKIIASDPIRATSRDVDNTVVKVQFPDRYKFEFTFYQQMLVGCQINSDPLTINGQTQEYP